MKPPATPSRVPANTLICGELLGDTDLDDLTVMLAEAMAMRLIAIAATRPELDEWGCRFTLPDRVLADEPPIHVGYEVTLNAITSKEYLSLLALLADAGYISLEKDGNSDIVTLKPKIAEALAQERRSFRRRRT